MWPNFNKKDILEKTRENAVVDAIDYQDTRYSAKCTGSTQGVRGR